MTVRPQVIVGMASDVVEGAGAPGSFIQEYELLSHLLSVLPTKAQRGLFSQDILYTCLDASSDYIAIGTNASIIYLYDRLGLKLQRLNIPLSLECVTKVKLAQSVDYVVAAGTSKGIVLIFQLPSYLPGRNKQLQLFQVADVHTSRISCFCWSANTERLFSGDAEGNVICTEIDYTKNQSRSYLVSQEPHEVVQLDYAHRALLISTKFRTVVVFVEEEFRKARVGQKDRKLFGNFGACFAPGLRRAEDAEIFATRPGLRLWRASIQGVVSVTYMFKDLLNEKTPLIPLLPDTKSESRTSRIEEKNFGLLHVFDEDKLVTWQDCTLFVIDPKQGTILGWHGNLGDVKEVAVTKDELFVLRNGPGSLIFRLAVKRDILNEVVSVSSEPAPLPYPTVSHQPDEQFEHMSEIPYSSAAAAASITVLQQTASKVSQGLIGTLKEKISQVQEGQRPSPVPPWGLVKGVVHQESEESVESAKEARSSSSTSLDVLSPMEPPRETPFAEERGPTRTTLDTKTSKDDRIDQQGVPGAHGTHRITPESSVTQNYTPPVIADNTVVKNTPIQKKKGFGDDIVYSRKPKKTKKKRKANDVDSDSIHSEEIEASYAISEQSDNISPTNGVEPLKVERQSANEQTCVDKHTTHGAKDSDVYSEIIDNLMQENDTKGDKSTAAEGRESDGVSRVGTEGGKHHSSENQSAVELSSDARGTSQELRSKGEKNNNLKSSPKVSHNKEASPGPSPGPSPAPSCAVRPSHLENLSSFVSNTPEVPSDIKSGAGKSMGESPAELMEGYKVNERKEDVTSEVKGHGNRLSTPKSNASPPLVNKEEDDLTEFPFSPSEATDSSMEDFYSHYQSSIYSPETPSSNVVSIQDALEAKETPLGLGHSSEDATSGDLKEIYTDTWTEFSCPGVLRSLALSHRQVWVVDKNERLHYSALQGPGLKWRKAEEPFHQVAVSPSGSIVWRLHRSLAYAATGVSARNQVGTKWSMSAKDVTYIAVDENVAWYIKSSGNIYLQKSLSRERPTYQAQRVECKQKLTQVACLAGVVWALTEGGRILVRTGIREGQEQGADWVKLDGEIEDIRVSHAVLGNEGTAWILDDTDGVWFTTDVCQANPFGSKLWWQVAISDYVIQDSTKATALKTLTHLPRMVTPADSCSGLIAAGSNGVWVCPGGQSVLQICRGSLTGHRWEKGSPNGIAASAKWQNVAANAATKKEGLLWVQQPNNAIFCFPPHTRKVMEIRLSGLKGLKSPTSQLPCFRSLCATRDVVWLLLDGGEIFVRTGMGAHCPQGINWEPLDLTQLGGVKLTSISCGAQNVWAVDSTGQVYLRIGLKPPSKNYLSPAWVPVDGSTQSDGAKFTKVITGPNDWVVWALDNKRCVYARGGITDALPIGTHWIYISGTKGEDLCISDSHVYALNRDGQLFVRFGVSESSVAGDYWKRIPGRLKSISTTHDEDLWGIQPDGQLQHRVTHFLERNNVLTGLQVQRCNSVSDDWEVI